jgi:hypothetical protein
MSIANDQYLGTFETASELTRSPVAGDPCQLIAVVVIVSKSTAGPVSPKRMGPEFNLGSEANVARQKAQGGGLGKLF